MAVTRSRRRPGNFPADLTTFVGRRWELSKVRRLLSGARLVTLTGVGGVGKTRLALQVAREVQRAFPDGVWLADLASAEDENLLSRVVAEDLGLFDQYADPLREGFEEYLRDRTMLLILDNCDHLVGPCAVLAPRLLRAAP